MATNNNLQDFLTDIANAIRTKTGTTQPINAQNFSTEILNIQTGGGGNTLKNLLDATKSASRLFSNYQGTSVDNLIQYGDTENVNNMSSMFAECINLASIPQLNTANVTTMFAAFQNCKTITTIPVLDTGKVNKMTSMFEYCNNITTIPLLNTSNVINMNYMFSGCNQLISVPALDVSKVTSFYQCFAACINLKSILMTNIGDNLDISASIKFEREDLLTILNNLKTVTETKTLTMGSRNLAKLTDEDKAIATNKGWTLA